MLSINAFPASWPASVPQAPLTLLKCRSCGLVQLSHTTSPDLLFGEYHYHSSTNETMVEALRLVVADALRRVDLRPGDSVLDIGCNDGTLLGFYPRGIHHIGFDPSDVALNAWHARGGFDLVRDYFPSRKPHVPELCKIITSIAQMYNVDDLDAYVAEVARWLHPEGVFITQFQDTHSILRANAVDVICHEHLTYLDCATLTPLFHRHGLEVVDQSVRDINGGSLRLVAMHRTDAGSARAFNSWPVPPTVQDWQDFGVRVSKAKQHLLGYLERHRYPVWACGASTKFNTLQQLWNLGPDRIVAVADRNPAKEGRYTVTGIPIVSEEAMRNVKPSHVLIGAWQFADAILYREAELIGTGTTFIVPLPDCRVGQLESHLRHIGPRLV